MDLHLGYCMQFREYIAVRLESQGSFFGLKKNIFEKRLTFIDDRSTLFKHLATSGDYENGYQAKNS